MTHEYKVVDCDLFSMENTLNTLAREGWRVIHLQRWEHRPYWLVVLEREGK